MSCRFTNKVQFSSRGVVPRTGLTKSCQPRSDSLECVRRYPSVLTTGPERMIRKLTQAAYLRSPSIMRLRTQMIDCPSDRHNFCGSEKSKLNLRDASRWLGSAERGSARRTRTREGASEKLDHYPQSVSQSQEFEVVEEIPLIFTLSGGSAVQYAGFQKRRGMALSSACWWLQLMSNHLGRPRGWFEKKHTLDLLSHPSGACSEI